VNFSSLLIYIGEIAIDKRIMEISCSTYKAIVRFDFICRATAAKQLYITTIGGMIRSKISMPNPLSKKLLTCRM